MCPTPCMWPACRDGLVHGLEGLCAGRERLGSDGPLALEAPDHRELLGDRHSAACTARGCAAHDQHIVAQVDDLLDLLRVVIPGLAGVRDPFPRPRDALEDASRPVGVEREVGIEAFAREGLEGLVVAALQRLVARRKNSTFSPDIPVSIPDPRGVALRRRARARPRTLLRPCGAPRGAASASSSAGGPERCRSPWWR
jgi:hypothetical protein